MKTICNKNHRYNPMFSVLPESQGKTGRHKCAGCAAELALMNKMMGLPPSADDSVLSELPESQAGNVRHKDAYAAYQMMYQY